MKTLQEKLFADRNNPTLLQSTTDHAVSYITKSATARPFPNADEIAGLSKLDIPFPDTGGDATRILDELAEIAGPACVNAIGGRYFGYVTGGVLPVALSARWLSDVWDQNAPLYLTSPVAAKFESVCEEWLKDILGFPADTVAGFVSGSSLGIYSGIAAARWRLLQRQGWDINSNGLNGAPPLRIIASRHAHATVIKAITLLGLGTNNIEWVEVDANGRVVADALPDLCDRSIVLLQAGNVNGGGFDDFANICAIANAENAWVHIDGAFGLWAAGAPSLKHLMQGSEHAQSWSCDAHKTLNTPYDGGIVFCRDRKALNTALHASGSYLTDTGERDGMLFTPELSRRARAIEIWAALKYLGRDGVGELVELLHQRTCEIADGLRNAGLEIKTDVVFNQALVRFDNDDARTEALIVKIQESEECWIAGADWFGERVIRISVCSWATSQDDVTRTIAAFEDAIAKLN